MVVLFKIGAETEWLSIPGSIKSFYKFRYSERVLFMTRAAYYTCGITGGARRGNWYMVAMETRSPSW